MAKKLTDVQRPSPYPFESALEYLRTVVEKSQEVGFSFREMAKQCGFATPNFFQKTLESGRPLTLDAAKKIAKAFGFAEREREYWSLLVKLEASTEKRRRELERSVRAFRELAMRATTKDTDIHRHWLHAAIFEMARIPNLPLTVDRICGRLRGMATRGEVEESLAFVLKKKWLIPTEAADIYQQATIEFDPYYDRRSVEMIGVHRAHLDQAKHRLNDPATETEFIGLTTAMPRRLLPEVQSILRTTISQIERAAAAADDCDEIMVVQMCAFRLTQD